MQQLTRTVVRNSAFGLGAQLAIKLLSFAFSVLIVRHLGADAFGQYAAVLAFGAVFVFVGDLGLSPYTVRAVARWRDAPGGAENTNALYGNVLVLRLLLSLLAASLVVGTAVLTERPPAMVGAIALGTLGLMMYGVQGTSAALLAGFERLDLSAGAGVLNQLTFVLAGGLMLWLGFGYYGLIVANLLGVAAMTCVCWRGVWMLGARPRRPATDVWPGLLKASLPFGVIGLALGLSYRFDSVLLNVYRGDAESGYYNAAYNLVFSTVVISNVLNTSLYPSLTRQVANNPAPPPELYERPLRYLMALSLPIAVGAWVLADRLVPFLFTASYLPAVPVLQIVIWAVPLMFASEYLGYVVVIRGDEARVARAVVISAGLNAALNLALVPRYGFFAAAVMTVATEAVLVAQYLWLLRATVRSFDWSRALLRPLLAAVVMGVLLTTLPNLSVPAAVSLGAVFYGGLLLVLGVVGREEYRFARSLHVGKVRGPLPEPARGGGPEAVVGAERHVAGGVGAERSAGR